MKNSSCCMPKINKMKTTHEQRKSEETKRLFRELFELQFRLEHNGDRSNEHVQMTIAMIDHLLENIIIELDG